MQDSIITFEARSEWFGLAARDVQEVARLRGVRPVPCAPGVIAGLAEVHGRIVTLIDLARLMAPGGEPAARGAARERSGDEYGVVLAPPRDHLGILVRSGVDVSAAATEDAEPPPGEASGWLQARLPIGDRLLNLLSLPALVARVEDTIRKGFRPETAAPGEER
ncbi:MAG: chemotaxis protein CheW [Acidobacteriota bacterium]